jgi:Holliday junction DNA helicase RuvA
VPRIGARIALNILSGISPEEFHAALAQGDLKRLTGIPGLGRKSAERIILELKGQMPPPASGGPPTRSDRAQEDALSALVNLGYPKATAEKALDAARSQGAASVEDLLRQSLKWLAK